MSRFQPGQSGNPGGKPKGCCHGRARVLRELDRMPDKKQNAEAMQRALEQEFQANPTRFFRTVIMPLLPRDSVLSLDRGGTIKWRSLLGGVTASAPGIQPKGEAVP